MSTPDGKRLVSAAAPVVAAVGVFGVSFGVLASTAGVPAWQAVLMSATVFAGSAQFASVALLKDGATVVSAIVSGALLNARYLPIGVAAGRVLSGGRLRRFLSAQLVVDESFAIGISAGSPARPDRRALLLSGAALWVVWVVGTALGSLIGPIVGDPNRLGFDAAFPALFVALLWPLLRSRSAIRAAAAGAIVAFVLGPFTPAGVPLLGAAVVGLVVA